MNGLKKFFLVFSISYFLGGKLVSTVCASVVLVSVSKTSTIPTVYLNNVCEIRFTSKRDSLYFNYPTTHMFI